MDAVIQAISVEESQRRDALHYLPVCMVDLLSVGTGTVMRPQTLRGYATNAGFSAVEILPVPFDFWYFYRLVP